MPEVKITVEPDMGSEECPSLLRGEGLELQQQLGSLSSPFGLCVENANMKCHIFQLEKELLLKSQCISDNEDNMSKMRKELEKEEQHRLKLGEDYSQRMLEKEACIMKYQEELCVNKDGYEEVVRKIKETQEICDQLIEKDELTRSELQRKGDEYSALLLQKNAEVGELEKKLGEAVAEKNSVDEKFRLFKNTVLNDLGNTDTGEENDNKLMLKIRLLQESNAELSAEVKNLHRKCTEAESESATLREELSLSDRMKNRLSSSLDTQSQEVELLEQKILLLNKNMLKEESVIEELKEANRNLELQATQSKFTIERLENSIRDMEDLNKSLEETVIEQKDEIKRWIERVKQFDEKAQTVESSLKRDLELQCQQQINVEKQKLSKKKQELEQALVSLKSTSDALGVANAENEHLKLRIIGLEEQLKLFDDISQNVHDFELQLEEKEDEIATLCQAFEKRGEAMKELEKRISLQASEISFLRPERDSSAQIAKGFEEQLNALKCENAELRRVSSQNDSRGAMIDELKATIMQYENRLNSITDDKEQLGAVNNELDSLKSKYRLLKDKYDESEETMVELSTTASEEIQLRDSEINSLKLTVEEMQKEISKLRSDAESLKKSKEKVEKKLKKEAAQSSSLFGFRNDGG